MDMISERENNKAYQENPKHITLYSARHQFVSDLKSMGVHSAAIAALLGHRSIKTAQTTYGRKKSGKNRFRMVLPIRSEVDSVIQNTPKLIMQKCEENHKKFVSKYM